MTDFGSPLNAALYKRAAPVLVKPRGSEGYFSQPSATQDPRLIDPKSKKIRTDVRAVILRLLYSFWDSRYVAPREWSTVWIAGSAISFQWGGRSDGDLDVLIGVDYTKFYERNPHMAMLQPAELDDRFNDEFHADLHPTTADYALSPGSHWEITFYVNHAATDIRSIMPYAAFDLTHNEWTVPSVNPGGEWDPRSHFSQDWWKTLDTEVEQAQLLVSQYDNAVAQLRTMRPNDPATQSALVAVRSAAERSAQFFDAVHDGRREAFKPGGDGFFGYGNLRWQTHKHYGTLAPLHSIKELLSSARKDADAVLYGRSVPTKRYELLGQGSSWFQRHLGTT